MESLLNLGVIFFDGLLVLGLLVLAWALLRSPDLFEATVLFISFGLIMSLAWVRLEAVDIALAEAAIGAGLTGALFLRTLGRIQRGSRENESKVDRVRRTARARKAITALGVLALAGILGWTVWTLPPYSDRMQNLVAANLPISGVENPVTAVLLNFRGYDTLLEIAVLLLAAVGVLSLAPTAVASPETALRRIQIVLLRLLPFIVVVSAYLLWIGKYAPGGAFQAGAVLAAGGVLLVTSAVRFNHIGIKSIPIGLSIGLLTFLAVALATMIGGGKFLQYPLPWASALILIIEAAATISIAVILTILYLGRKPDGGNPSQSNGGRQIENSR
jgi:multisubunit Na+/H+ antiporter MnhB subunit